MRHSCYRRDSREAMGAPVPARDALRCVLPVLRTRWCARCSPALRAALYSGIKLPGGSVTGTLWNPLWLWGLLGSGLGPAHQTLDDGLEVQSNGVGRPLHPPGHNVTITKTCANDDAFSFSFMWKRRQNVLNPRCNQTRKNHW